MALIATKGYAAPEVVNAFARARELCRQSGETPQLFRVLMGLWAFYLLRAELETARELSEQLARLAQRLPHPTLQLWAHFALGETLHSLGELAPAREQLERGIALYQSQHYRAHAFDVQDPGVPCLAFAAWILWDLGYLDQARARNREALTLADELAYPLNQVFALNCAAVLSHFCHDAPAAQKAAEVVMTLSSEHGFAHQAAMGSILRGWALAEQGRQEEGRTQIREGLAAYRATGAELIRHGLEG